MKANEKLSLINRNKGNKQVLNIQQPARIFITFCSCNTFWH